MSVVRYPRLMYVRSFVSKSEYVRRSVSTVVLCTLFDIHGSCMYVARYPRLKYIDG